MNYKDTLLTPNTLFEMKANLTEKEPKIQLEWLRNNVVGGRYHHNAHQPPFILHDGPPYANGDLHVGHALNKILKDFIVRYYNQKGYYSPWICGWDTHGLPIETAVVKSGVDRKTTPPVAFRQICRKYALEQIDKQIEQFSRLGLFSDFTNRYVTLDLEYELEQLRLFQTMVQKQLIYRQLKPIYWSPSSESALAEAEIEYEELSAPSIYVTFNVTTGNSLISPGTKIVIWTTTPWTIPMNQLLAVGTEIVYVEVLVQGVKYLVAKALLEAIQTTIGWEEVHILQEVSGTALVGIVTKHPLYDRDSIVVLGHHVTTEAGTGIVHTASGFGEDDYHIARANNIPIFAPLDDEGKYTKEVNDETLTGVFYENANKMIGQRLEQEGALLKLKFIKHKHPIDWRTKKPVIYRATAQWFVSIKKMKPALLAEIKKVQWNPSWAAKRMETMIENRQDWCISRQRLWGVPIIAFYDENNVLQFNSELIDHVIKLFQQAKTTDIWFEWTADQLLPPAYQKRQWRKEQDIMDVWFDSGVSNLAVTKAHQLPHPVSVYLEGIDQFRGWFNSSLITSVVATGHAPYQIVLSHGFANDEKGRKMSKSLGNVISPLVITAQYGADILRMWVAAVDYRDDVKIGPDILKQVAEAYRKIRNTLRFLLANLTDFNPATDLCDDLAEVDWYVLHLAREFQQKVNSNYEEFNFNNVYMLINNFVTTTLSKFYLDFTKDILYIEAMTSSRRRAVQTTLYYLYRILSDALKPIIPHTIEESHKFIKYPHQQSSVHLEENFVFSKPISLELVAKWEQVLKLRDDVNKELEYRREQKEIKKSLECQLTIALKPAYAKLATIADLHQIFIVSEIIFTPKHNNLTEYETSYITAQEKDGFKCQRCWMIYEHLNAENNDICDRCFNVLLAKNVR
ncbi:MAG: isoleucine--tRNA ligase [Spiroplasma poulsonii]|uniref:Isoleucine--tRNA ligase n=1 Tax=Spiroplasma poulsonii TaxID=2138 RepID=A0A2P6FCK4_9MOLU|nr:MULTISPECIES: isoleucine--tRNA ligase [Spiroplasma]KAF0851520.1 Isoleucine--tRNA ligase [Spiroplasma poulsonii]MBH8622711.1 isoleucine--tRNA ligase [Spiroplasma sp. hyd1]MBW1241583.1 isoleucine--tRNA ligase [Spiroplasma poulsonii]PQM31114.1 Isoleucine--tRNA ligase [Spiroplasma poulsonii]PWF96113.1 Isoleucine--tRNA ligase [Spiroplasma poulsonii]